MKLRFVNSIKSIYNDRVIATFEGCKVLIIHNFRFSAALPAAAPCARDNEPHFPIWRAMEACFMNFLMQIYLLIWLSFDTGIKYFDTILGMLRIFGCDEPFFN